jgi:hypothetical protein
MQLKILSYNYTLFTVPLEIAIQNLNLGVMLHSFTYWWINQQQLPDVQLCGFPLLISLLTSVSLYWNQGGREAKLVIGFLFGCVLYRMLCSVQFLPRRSKQFCTAFAILDTDPRTKLERGISSPFLPDWNRTPFAFRIFTPRGQEKSPICTSIVYMGLQLCFV